MSKKKKHEDHEEHIDESWLIPYADLLTLLLALFIVLFASSSVDATKFKQISDSFTTIFSGGTGVMNYPSETIPQENPKGTSNVKDKKGDGETTRKELQEVKDKVDQYIKNSKLQGSLKTQLTDEGLLITITNDVLFDSGSAIIRTNERSIATQISKLLISNPPLSIIISGHTDNIPIKNELFQDNWDLSVTRAVNFMKIMLENKKLKPQSFSAKGYGEYKPIASNHTQKGRAKNRRVEILVLPSNTNPNTK